MSYKLEKPYTDEQYADFVVEYNHNQGLNIEETEMAVYALEYNEIIIDGEPVIDPDYEEKQKNLRQENFYNNFLATSKGNYRLMPKGYANAQQSIDTVNAIVMAMQGLTEDIANMIIFYDTPDFTKEEECTEEWLIQHQHHPEPMTVQEWVQFYIEFTTLYAQQQYKAGLML